MQYVKKIGTKAAQSPARTARRHKADVMVAGRIRCPGRRCRLDVVIHRRSGQVWLKATETAPRTEVPDKAAQMAQSLLDELGLLRGSVDRAAAAQPEQAAAQEEVDYDFNEGEEETPVPEVNQAEDNEVDVELDDEEERSIERPEGPEFDAVELYLTGDLSFRFLCVDLTPVLQDDDICGRSAPELNPADDRVYNSNAFFSLGLRFALFPGAFFERRRWFSHIGMYGSYNHSLGLKTVNLYEMSGGEGNFEREIGTQQQEAQVGLIYRISIPPNRPAAPQIRVMVGYGFYDYRFDDNDYPLDSEIRRIDAQSNPYLPSFSYHTVDFGLGFRYPWRDLLFPYTSLTYRLGLHGGQAYRIYGPDGSTHGLDWTLGLAVEIPRVGLRFFAEFDLTWWGTRFEGMFSPKDEEERFLWGADIIPGNTASDPLLRLRFGFGWVF